MAIGNLISRLVTIGLILATLGTLAEVTNTLRSKAIEVHQLGVISIGKLNRRLHEGR